MVSAALLLASLVAFVIATAIGFDWIDSTYYGGWLALGLLLGVAASLVGPVSGYVSARRGE